MDQKKSCVCGFSKSSQSPNRTLGLCGGAGTPGGAKAGDVQRLLRHVQHFEATCHETGMPNAYRVSAHSSSSSRVAGRHEQDAEMAPWPAMEDSLREASRARASETSSREALSSVHTSPFERTDPHRVPE